jgi:hypothetical protein
LVTPKKILIHQFSFFFRLAKKIQQQNELPLFPVLKDKGKFKEWTSDDICKWIFVETQLKIETRICLLSYIKRHKIDAQGFLLLKEKAKTLSFFNYDKEQYKIFITLFPFVLK